MDYVFAVRSVRKGEFTNEPGATHFLEVPGNATTLRTSHKIKKTDWIKKVV